MLFRGNPNSRIGRRILLARLAFASAYCKALHEKGIPLAKEAKKLDQQVDSLHEMAFLALEAGEYPRFAWLRLCAKLVFYKAGWTWRRSKKLRAKHHRSLEKANELIELLGFNKKDSAASVLPSHDKIVA